MGENKVSEKFCRLPDAELEVMKVVWEFDAPVSTIMIMERLKYKNWHISTVLKLISRLTERGFIKSEKNGRYNVYVPLVNEAVYLKSETKSFLERLHGNSVKSLIATLYNTRTISKEELDEIAKIIEKGGSNDV